MKTWFNAFGLLLSLPIINACGDCPEEDVGGPIEFEFEVTNELEVVRVQCVMDGEIIQDVTRSTSSPFSCPLISDTIIVSSPGLETLSVELDEPTVECTTLTSDFPRTITIPE